MPAESTTESPPGRGAMHQFVRLVGVVRPYWGSLAKGMTLSLAIGLLVMVPPYLAKVLIDRVYVSHDMRLMYVLIAGTLCVEFGAALVGGVRSYFVGLTSFQLTNATSLLFFNHLQHLRIRFFEEHRVGEIASRFQDVRTSVTAASRIFESMLVNGSYLIWTPLVLFLFQWKLALVAIPTAIAPALVLIMSGRYLRQRHRASAEAYGELSAYQVEVLTQIRTLKSMGLERHMYEKANEHTRAALGMQVRALGVAQGFGTLHGMVKAIGTAVYLFVAWRLILAQELTLGGYVAFSIYMGFLNAPLLQLTSLVGEFQQTSVSLARMFEYLDQPPEQDPALVAQPLPALQHVLRGGITLRGVTYGHSPDRTVLHDLTAEFPAGTVTAIVGPSGAGKSTLLRLLMGLDEPRRGEILIDGIPMGLVPLDELRRQVGVVWQEVALLRGTIWENLTLGATDPSRERVDEAVRICRLESLIADLPRRYETPIAEWGSSLSGGQRQRIAIARAIVRDTPVLLLDEATANIDVETEALLLRELFIRLRGRTLVYVTHRVATAALADQICLLDQGRIVDVGPHECLLKTSDIYRRLYLTATRPHAEVQSRVLVHPS